MRRPSPAMVVALIALTVALGGGAYAAIKLPRASVGARQLKKGAVTPPKLAASTVKRLKGKTGPRGATGAAGMPGTPGTPGETGQTGPPGPGAKLLVTEPVASATDQFVELGKAGPFTLHTRCRISGGTVDAYLIATGPSLTSDSTYVRSGGGGGTVTVTESDFKVANPTTAAPKVLTNSSATAGGEEQTAWVSGLLQAQSSVSVQAWVRAESAGGGFTDSCRFSAIVTPLE